MTPRWSFVLALSALLQRETVIATVTATATATAKATATPTATATVVLSRHVGVGTSAFATTTIREGATCGASLAARWSARRGAVSSGRRASLPPPLSPSRTPSSRHLPLHASPLLATSGGDARDVKVKVVSAGGDGAGGGAGDVSDVVHDGRGGRCAGRIATIVTTTVLTTTTPHVGTPPRRAYLTQLSRVANVMVMAGASSVAVGESAAWVSRAAGGLLTSADVTSLLHYSTTSLPLPTTLHHSSPLPTMPCPELPNQ